MRLIAGIAYIATGLLCGFVYMLMVGAMLGMTSPVYSVTGLFTVPLFGIGPALLVLSGVATLFQRARRGILCLITSSAFVAGLAVWTVPKIGWRDAGWLLLEPAAVSFLIASLISLVLKKRWVGATIGCFLSAPIFVYGTGSLLYAHLFGKVAFSGMGIWLAAPLILIILSFVLALRVRTA